LIKVKYFVTPVYYTHFEVEGESFYAYFNSEKAYKNTLRKLLKKDISNVDYQPEVEYNFTTKQEYEKLLQQGLQKESLREEAKPTQGAKTRSSSPRPRKGIRKPLL